MRCYGKFSRYNENTFIGVSIHFFVNTVKVGYNLAYKYIKMIFNRGRKAKENNYLDKKSFKIFEFAIIKSPTEVMLI